MPIPLGVVMGANIAGGALTGLAGAVQKLYQMGGSVNSFLDAHIAELKASDTQVISSTGRVLEATKLGFGMGYVSSMTVLAAGQMLLGNPLSAAAVVLSPLNPVAMTCAALGAIYYGWRALSAKEQDLILSRLAEGFEIGVEIVKAIINFVVTTTKDLLSSKHVAEFKQFIQVQASAFGRSLYSVTHEMIDFVSGTTDKAVDLIGDAARETSTAAKRVYDDAREKVQSLRARQEPPKALPEPPSDAPKQ